jgi:hypothetical protein
MKRTIISIVSSILFVGLTVLGLLVHRASPAPETQVVRGVALGRYDSEAGFTFLSGRRLDCVPQADAPFTDTCTMELNDRPLTIQAVRNGPEHPNQLGGACTATYAGQTWACNFGSRHVHIHHFVYIPEPLGLETAQLQTLQQQYWIENLPEEPFLAGSLAAPFVALLAFLGGWWAWRRPFTWRGWATAVGLSVVVWIGTFASAFTLTSGFWD